MMSSGANPESSVDVVVGHGSWVICARRVYVRCARVSRTSSVFSWVVVGECVVENVSSVVMTYGCSSVRRCLSLCSS